MRIELLGICSKKSKTLFSNTLEALKACGVDGKVVVINDIQTILKYGIKSTPALAINGVVVMVGTLATSDEILKLLQQNLSYFT